ncbi:MAG: sigma-E factor negative regulatory protein [Pseudomonadales bacterium]|nr:sigma-E factor negative regulatory protein [Pseudomonadales bacterium]
MVDKIKTAPVTPPTHSADRDAEAISALMDGEANDLDLRRLLKSAAESPETMEIWQRYHLAQSVMHEQGTPVSTAVASGVAAALADEAAYSAEPQRFSAWQQQLTKLAVAAAVAVLAVLTLQPDPAGSMPTSELAQEAPSNVQAAPLAVPATLVAETLPATVDPEAQQRLRDYIESMSFDGAEPVRMEHIQDSPLYRLVNDLPASPD